MSQLTLTGAGKSAGMNVATYTVTTTGAQTHTIQSLGVSAPTVVDWGDGSRDTYSGTALRTHNYAGAGTWLVTIYTPKNVVTFDIRDNKVTLNSAQIAGMLNISTFSATTLKAGTFNSADVSAWRPTTFSLYSMPAGYAGTFDSADVSAWRPTNFYLYSMPAGYSVTADGGWANWITTTTFQVQSNGLLTATVDAILWELYQATLARTATGGTINVGGTNQAPSGVFQAASACPVSAATSGKEIAHELLNDGCDAIAAGKTWATVTITA